MKTLMISLIPCIMIACNNKAIKGSGVEKTETRTISEFESIHMASIGDYDVKVGLEPKLVIKADDNILELIKTEMSEKTLIIEQDKGVSNTEIKFEIQTPNLKKIKTSSVVKAHFFNLNGETLQLDSSGVSTMKLQGNVKEFTISSSGLDTLDATALIAQKVKLASSGSGSFQVNAKQSLDIKLSGASKVSYMGEPELKKNISGLASVKKLQ